MDDLKKKKNRFLQIYMISENKEVLMRKWTAFYCHCWRAHSLFLFFFSKSLSKTAIVLRCWPRARVLAVAPGNQNFHQSDPVFFHIDVGQWEQNSLLNLVIMSRRPQTALSLLLCDLNSLSRFEDIWKVSVYPRPGQELAHDQVTSDLILHTDKNGREMVHTEGHLPPLTHVLMSFLALTGNTLVTFHGSCDVGGDSWVDLCGLCGPVIDLGFIVNVTQFYSKLLYFNANS